MQPVPIDRRRRMRWWLWFGRRLACDGRRPRHGRRSCNDSGLNHDRAHNPAVHAAVGVIDSPADTDRSAIALLLPWLPQR